jgi:cytochrome c-type biogenesis protein CcmH/NrfF
VLFLEGDKPDILGGPHSQSSYHHSADRPEETPKSKHSSTVPGHFSEHHFSLPHKSVSLQYRTGATNCRIRSSPKSNDNVQSSMKITRWKMTRTACCVAGLWLCLASSMNAETPLNPVQQRRAALLYTEFIAPCCWRQSVSIHQSEASLKVRSEIDSKILLGDSDSQIKAALVKEYGHGILMKPEGIRAFLAYSLPIVFFLVGLLAVANWMWRRSRGNPDSQGHPDLNLGEWPDCELDA